MWGLWDTVAGVLLTAVIAAASWILLEIRQLRLDVDASAKGRDLDQLGQRLEDKMDDVQADIIRVWASTSQRVARLEGALAPPPGHPGRRWWDDLDGG